LREAKLYLRVELELRNLPRARVLEYLAEAKGQPAGELAVRGDGWLAWLEPMEPAQVGSIAIPCDLLVIVGKAAAVEPVQALMRSRTMRGGG
jgi:hypothetical protein